MYAYERDQFDFPKLPFMSALKSQCSVGVFKAKDAYKTKHSLCYEDKHLIHQVILRTFIINLINMFKFVLTCEITLYC